MGILEKFSLSGKVAIVTGGAGLYGKFIVEGLAEAGATIYVASRNVENCEKLAERLRDVGYSVFSTKLDQANEKSIKEMKEKILKEQGRVDILVNNAGTILRNPAFEHPDEY